MRLVYSIDQLEAPPQTMVGGKAANLARLRRAGFPVPPAFVVSTHAYGAFVEQNGLRDRLLAVAREALDDGATAALFAAADQIRRAIEGAPLPAAIEAEIRDGYANLGGDGVVAVRSSAAGEDSAHASHAGQYETFLSVTDAATVIHRVRGCWASLWNRAALAYRSRFPSPLEQAAMAVVVQQHVHAEVSGVMFTAHPVTGRRDQMVIEAVPGAGDALMSGRAAPDHWVLEADTWALAEGPILQADRPYLSPEQLSGLAALGQEVAGYYGVPLDLEWAYVGGRLHVLQARPITNLP